MDHSLSTLPKTHQLKKNEKDFIKTLDAKHLEIHTLAVQWLETSYRPEWSHMYRKASKNDKTSAKN